MFWKVEFILLFSVMQTSKGKYLREMTVAQIREQSSPDHTEIVFLESARFYTLRKNHPEFTRLMHLLKDAKQKNRIVKVYLSSMESDIIVDIKE